MSLHHHRGVNYSCGQCGYELNLNSCNRNTSSLVGSENSKSLKSGSISFFSVDESRFNQTHELRFIPYLFISTWSWGFFRRRTTLNCKKCGSRIGWVKRRSNKTKKEQLGWDGISGEVAYDIRIQALLPSDYNQTYRSPMIT